MKTNHTPGELRQVQPGSNFQRGLGCAVLKIEDQAIATVAMARSKGFANATRFVLTWNSHDELVAALTAILHGLDSPLPNVRAVAALIQPSIDAAKRAIDKASGQ